MATVSVRLWNGAVPRNDGFVKIFGIIKQYNTVELLSSFHVSLPVIETILKFYLVQN